MARILIVEDEASIRDLIEMNLSLVGHESVQAQDGETAVRLLSNNRCDLVLLDVMLPGCDGFSLAQIFFDRAVPVIFLTARTAVRDRVKGLRMGADDYITKPFEPAELLARVDVALRRAGKSEEGFEVDGAQVRFAQRTVYRDGQPVELAAQEFDLLCALIRNRNIALSREQLLQCAWGYDYLGETRTVDVHIQRLRKKLGLHSLETVYKFGYRLNTNGGELR